MIITSANPIQDEQQRQQALDISQSFIVQAPAGSGKTELLTQRFLMLLTQVNAPEEILAITFTKKAAAEMRARIIKTLQQAATQPEPETAHAKKTWRIARQALQQSSQLQWDLLDNPSRLRIQTIDSFNASLVKRLPILSQFGASPDITDDALPLYREAIQEFPAHLENAGDWSEPIAQLLLHCDNNINNLEELLIEMLGKRDQWLGYIAAARTIDNLRERLEADLQAVVSDILAKLNRALPPQPADELFQIAKFAGSVLRDNDADSPLINFAELDGLPSTTVDNLPLWLAIKELLLTKERNWRKSFTKNDGFPAPSGAKGAQKILYTEMKKRIAELISVFNEDSQLLSALHELHYAPAPEYSAAQWQVLIALHHILLLAIAELYVAFQNHGQIDYIQNALGALNALGHEDSPTDLALALDYQIKHILIDEFQDTSSSQFQLLKFLTAGWQTGDGRTLFIVGDPMQSIYRFREADVGLFIRARKEGLGHLKLIPLTLSVNFRSTPQIVAWVNHSFQKILPLYDDISTGAVSYNPSIANDTSLLAGSGVKIHVINNQQQSQQARDIVELIQEKRHTEPHGKIAILVRARAHLKDIIPALKSARLSYRAIKIDPLNTRQVIQDLMALTRALVNPADKVAWLAILRAPWCGLSLADLLALTSEAAIYQTINHTECLQKLSPEGQQRLARVRTVLTEKLAERQRLSLAMWVKSTWLMLGGPACLEQDADLDDVTTYFALLEKLDRGGNLTNLDQLDYAVSKLYAAPSSHADDTLQIMTIHNAKGLEFDTVILPYLEKKSPPDNKQLLLFMETVREQSTNALILAPLPALGKDDDKIYGYVKNQHKTKMEHEIGRLLYVAATRAKQHLHLFLTINPDRNIETTSLLHKLQPAIAAELENFAAAPALATINEMAPVLPRFIQRLVNTWQNPLQEISIKKVMEHQTLSTLRVNRDLARQTGTVVHLVLQQISRLGIPWWRQHDLSQQACYLKNQLLQVGVAEHELTSASGNAQQAIHNALGDARGLWILQSSQEAQTEFAVTAVIDGNPQQLKIDKTFVDAGQRWIIDYKTTPFSGGEIEIFLRSEQQKHIEQMRHYFQAMRALDEKPIHLGLYFPMIPAWKEWTFH
ncbi:MAG: UvrD-helicase domain-containing protein [Pseudomonadota bacterium]